MTGWKLRTTCDICGVEKNVQQYYQNDLCLCVKHRHQLDRHGEFFERTYRDANEIIIKNGVGHVIINNRKGEKICEALVDEDNVIKIIGMRWGYSDGYAVTKSKLITGSGLMHRVLFHPPKGKEIDHINGNGLDDRRKNIRFVTRSQNAFNKDKQSNNTSGFRGVWFDKARNKWHVELKCGEKMGGKKKHLGRFDDFDEAVRVRIAAEKKYFGKHGFIASRGKMDG